MDWAPFFAGEDRKIGGTRMIRGVRGLVIEAKELVTSSN